MAVEITAFFIGENMTVPVSDRLSQLYVGNGTNVRFDFNFRVFQQEDGTGIAVRQKGSIEFATIDPTTYVVTVNQDGMGGYITFSEPPEEGIYFYIAGLTALDQLLDITNYDNFYPDALERALDKLTALLQERGTQLDLEKQARILADIHYDALAMEREADLENRLLSYINAIIAITNPAIFDGISDRMIVTQSGITQRELNNSLPFWTGDYAKFKQETYAREEQIIDHTNESISQAQSLLNSNIQAETSRATSAEGSLQAQINSVGVGNKAYQTYSAMDADKANIPANSKVTVTNDGTASNNGDWQWNGTTFTKSAYDPLSQTKPFIDVLSNTNQRQAETFYHAPSDVVVKDTHSDLFAVSVKVQPKQKYVINTKTFGIANSYYITDASNNVLRTLVPSDTLEQDYVIEIPANGAMLYTNCLYSYADFKLYLLNNELSNLSFAGLGVNDFKFYTGNDSSSIIANSHVDFFSKSIDVAEGEYYQIRTATYGVAPQYLLADSSNTITLLEPSGNRGKDFIIHIPKNAAKLYVNCTYNLRNSFKVEKISEAFANSLSVGAFVLDYTFFYAPSSTIKQESNEGLFAVVLDVQANQKYSIFTKTFGVVGEYYVTDNAGNILQFKASDSVEEEYIITIPVNASKLYVNCIYDFADSFNFERISNALLANIPFYDKPVRSVFPTFNYFDQLRSKCPNFYRKFKDKNEDVCVILTGTSLTQGNLYTTDRADATTRPAALHTNDLASSIFDKLIKHWDGQKYRRYDHADLTYSNSSWAITNNIGSGTWDDYAHIKNGLTKTTTDANASVSMTIPANAWQFNFVYRSDSQGGGCTISITEGNGKIEVFDGVSWIEANGYTFTMYESPATATKGNTQYQKRLKMRCKNKASGGINSIGSTKQITISKGNNLNRFNVVGFEWSQREFMLFVINGARGGFEWGDPTGNRLDQYQDTDIWSFNPDLLLAEITTINWGASEPTALTVDPLHYVNIAKRAYFNEFNDMPTSLHAKSEAYTKCDVIFYSDTLAASSAVGSAWDSTTYEPKFGTVTTAATNGAIVDTSNVGRVKTNFENYEVVERYIASKEYLFIPILSTFKSVAENYYGSYWAAMQPSDKTGTTLSIDGVHFNDNGAALFSKIVASVFDGI